MPIRPENKSRYPKNWKEIRLSILERADNKCEFCGAPNHQWRMKTDEGKEFYEDDPMQLETWVCVDGMKATKIVLTIAHLDHQPENCDPENLRALCQRCHLRYDKEHHAESRRNNKKLPLFERTKNEARH